jgi:hypothetical protein
MSKYVIVWNENKNEGVIFKDDYEGVRDAFHAGGGSIVPFCSSLGDAFRDIYGNDQTSYIQRVDIDSSLLNRIEKSGEDE